MSASGANAAAQRSLIIALSLAATGSAASMRVIDAQLTALAAGFDASLAAAAQTITAFSVAYGLAQLGFGPLGDRFGKWRVVAAAVTASALTAAACALAPNLTTLVIARLLAGATCGGIIPLAMAWLGDAVPYERRQLVIARFLAGQMAGFAVGQWIGGLAGQTGAWRLPFAALAIWFAVCAVMMWRARRRAEAAVPFLPRSGDPLRESLHVLAQPWARVVLAVVFIEGVLLIGAWAFAPTHLQLAAGLSPAQAGTVVMFYAFGGLLFAASAGRWVQRLGETGMARAGGLLMAAALALIALLPGFWIGVLAAAVVGFGYYLLHNTLQLNATQMAPAARGAAVALFASSFFVGQTIGVAIAGSLIERIGSAAILLAAAALLPALAFSFARLRARHVPETTA